MGKFTDVTGEIKTKFMEGNIVVQLGVVIALSLVVIFIIHTFFMILKRLDNFRKGSPILIKTIKDAKQRKVIKQNGPKSKGYIGTLLRRSRNENGGIEFTYRLWFYIDDWTYKYGSWKHMFHKGNYDSWPNRAPGVWLHPTKNIMRVYMNTYNKIAEHVDVPNIPIKKWVHLAIICKSRNLNIYINGQLRTKLKLQSLPKQNYGDLFINAFGGFSGYMSKMVYHDFALPVVKLRKEIPEGPSTAPCPGTDITPPYLATNWWQLKYD